MSKLYFIADFTDLFNRVMQLPFDPLSLDGSARTNRYGRHIHGNYFASTAMDDLGATHPDSIQWRIDAMREYATRLGFDSVFDAATATARSDSPMARTEIANFVQSGGLNELYAHCRRSRAFESIVGDENLSELPDLFQTAVDIYAAEWDRLMSDEYMRQPLTSFSEDRISAFSFEETYDRMKTRAPCFFSLIESLTANNTSSTDPERMRLWGRRRCRFIVVAISILCRLRSQLFNVVQGPLAYYLFASRVPKKVIGVLHHLGISVSYPTLQIALDNNAKSCLSRLRSVCSGNRAPQISFDNLTSPNHVRDERVHNQDGFWSATAGFLVLPPIELSRPMFTQVDINYNLAMSLTVRDFLPSDSDHDNMRLAFSSLIWRALRQFSKEQDIQLPPCSYPMPSVDPLNRHHRSEILPLPTYPLSESKIVDMIEIHYRIAEHIGLSAEQVQNALILFKGDYMTSANTRYVL